jgi:hypothetical protein
MWNLKYEIVNRHGALMTLEVATGNERPATSFEVDLWDMIAKDVHPHKETYMRVNEADFLSLMNERAELKKRLGELQKRYDELCSSIQG